MKLCANCGWMDRSIGAACPRCSGNHIALLARVSPASTSAKPLDDHHYHLAVCPTCQQLCAARNEFDPQWVNCPFCNQDLTVPMGMKPDPGTRRLVWVLTSITTVCIGIGIARWHFASKRLEALIAHQTQELTATKSSWAAALAEEIAGHQRAEAALEQAHESHLKDPSFLSGEGAEARHEIEWNLRTQHDPRFAKTPMETTLLTMERLGKDPSIAAIDALREVALLAAPKGSRIEVSPSGNGFSVKVAFKLSALARNESGGITKHHSADALREEVRQVSAQLTRQLFDYCGSRGIERLQLSCNRALRRTSIPGNATEAEKRELLRRAPLTMASIYRLSVLGSEARNFTAWRTTPNRAVMDLFHIESDGLLTLSITLGETERGSIEDPNSPLEF